jgi:TPR repeat protein
VLMVEGTVLPRNLPEAERLLTKSAEAGHVLAMIDLGDLHDARDNEQGWSQAAKWYARAADRGNSTAMVRLGILQQDGKGVLKDEAAAATLYRKAADDGSSSGMHNLALLYDKGNGVDRRDPELAASLMLQAIDLGDQFSLKEMAQNSRRWSLDYRRAFQRKLKDAGFYEGGIDGSFGHSTLSALNDYINRKKK